MSTTSVTSKVSNRFADPETAANLCLLAARAFAQPDLLDSEDPGRLASLCPQLPEPVIAPATRLAEVWADALATDREPLSLAYAKLFLGPFEIASPPYASLYLDPERKLMGTVSMDVGHAYAEAGLGPTESGPREAPDHIALELEFLYYLAYQTATEDDPAWLERYGKFADQHLAHWAPQLADAIREADAHPYYKALADLLAPTDGETPFYSLSIKLNV